MFSIVLYYFFLFFLQFFTIKYNATVILTYKVQKCMLKPCNHYDYLVPKRDVLQTCFRDNKLSRKLPWSQNWSNIAWRYFMDGPIDSKSQLLFATLVLFFTVTSRLISFSNFLDTATIAWGVDLLVPLVVVSSSTFYLVVHAFVCTRIDYCCIFRLSPLQSVLNVAGRLIARLPLFSHDYLHFYVWAASSTSS